MPHHSSRNKPWWDIVWRGLITSVAAIVDLGIVYSDTHKIYRPMVETKHIFIINLKLKWAEDPWRSWDCEMVPGTISLKFPSKIWNKSITVVGTVILVFVINIIKAPHCRPFVRGIDLWQMNSLHKDSEMRKCFLVDIIVKVKYDSPLGYR